MWPETSRLYRFWLWLRGYQPIERYEYYFHRPFVITGPKETRDSYGIRSGRDYGAWGNLGSQGWYYVGIHEDTGLEIWERKSRW